MKAGLIAAGLGERLVAAGIDTPKPLVAVAGKALVDHVLDAVAAAGIDAACIFNAEPPASAVSAAGRAPARRG
ncbi:MAG: NTP transferase domain-containing protein [Candidatus Binatia bacterium]